MNIIFLDVDGILNSQQEMVSQNVVGTMNYEGLNQVSLGLLRTLCELTEAKIVISSTWRSDGHEAIAGAFEAKGWHGILMRTIIIGVTPHLNTNRGGEIDEWLMSHPEVTNYVIVDDDADMLDSQMDNFVHVDNIMGFTLYDMVKAMDILGIVDNPEKIKRADDLRNIIDFKINKRFMGCDYSI